ncbi:MAG: tRNA (adenine(22)-N(1))-methyltransferase TrmK, partial [Clostridia bacterium]|nr:tRNA (adenine(22)-N(1))-methyltransferase TrmK [Clostridia bacterium]
MRGLGIRFADIGTDHAYLPIFLLQKGKIECAYASDINKGPIENANENLKKY